MCGRIALIQSDENKLKKRFKLKQLPKGQLKPRYNIAPAQPIAAITNEHVDELTYLQWGLVPSWAKEINTKYSMINAKAETIAEKPAYRGPIRHKRCLIIVDTFYEWKRTDGAKQPYRFMMKDAEPFALAGVWDCWNKDGGELKTCSIITTNANQLMQPIHERMPVIMEEDQEELWLSDIDYKEAIKLLGPYRGTDLEAHEISTMVNSPQNDSAEILEAVH